MDLLKQINDNELNYLNYNQVAKILASINGRSEVEIRKELDYLLSQGLLINTSKKKIATSSKVGIISGTITIAKKGYGFLIPDDPKIKDVFIPEELLNGAMQNDKVLVQKSYSTSDDKCEGKVIKIVSHGLHTLVGKVIDITSNFALVSPDSKKVNSVAIRSTDLLGAKKGDKVVVELTKYNSKMPEGKIIEVLLSDNPINVDVLSIVRDFELYEEFPDYVLVSADKVKKQVTEEDIKNRVDLRNLNTFTIDGEDARDFDDAVSIEDCEDGTVMLGVHIADVGEYVPRDSILDREAFKRGTSTYFPNAVFPMLPKQLSNDICSLKEGVDRLTLSCLMKIDANGNVVSHKICESVIKSKARMTYNKVAKMLDGDKELNEKYSFLVKDLAKMKKLALILEKVRENRGALNFDIPEPKIILDENLEIEKFEKRPNTMADRIIESFMLIANETVAKEFEKRKIPFVYRVHEKPDSEKLENFAEFAEAFGYKFSGDFEKMPAKKIQKFLNNIPEEKRMVINKVLLRSMQKAKYSADCMGHYGLGAEYYCHFTSPIRRYPDLTIHRIIKSFLRKELNETEIKKLKPFVIESASQSSQRETISDKAEIQVDEYFKARYMQKQKGKIFDGIISGVTERGIYVELDNTCEGFISVYNLPDKFYDFNDKKYTLTGSSTKFTIGDKMTIKVSDVNLESRKVDFIFIDKTKNKSKKNDKESLDETNSK